VPGRFGGLWSANCRIARVSRSIEAAAWSGVPHEPHIAVVLGAL
jgi:hypothetical protein